MQLHWQPFKSALSPSSAVCSCTLFLFVGREERHHDHWLCGVGMQGFCFDFANLNDPLTVHMYGLTLLLPLANFPQTCVLHTQREV